MSSATLFFLFIPLLAGIFLTVNFLFAPHNTYQEKNSPFECGFHSFLGQNRTQFSISFFIFALLFLLFDLEILLVYPYAVSAYTNTIYGLAIMVIFFLALTLGFVFELGKNALKIDSRQIFTIFYNYITTMSSVAGFLLKYSAFNSKIPYIRAILLDYLNVIKSSIYDLKNIDIISVLKRNAKLRLSLFSLGLILFYVFELDYKTVNLILYSLVMCLVLHKFSKITNLKDFLYMLIQFIIFVFVLCLFWYLLHSILLLLLPFMPDFIWIKGDMANKTGIEGGDKEPNKQPNNKDSQTPLHKSPDSEEKEENYTTKSSKTENYVESSPKVKPNKPVSDDTEFARNLAKSIAKSDNIDSSSAYRSMIAEGHIHQSGEQQHNFSSRNL